MVESTLFHDRSTLIGGGEHVKRKWGYQNSPQTKTIAKEPVDIQ